MTRRHFPPINCVYILTTYIPRLRSNQQIWSILVSISFWNFDHLKCLLNLGLSNTEAATNDRVVDQNARHASLKNLSAVMIHQYQTLILLFVFRSRNLILLLILVSQMQIFAGFRTKTWSKTYIEAKCSSFKFWNTINSRTITAIPTNMPLDPRNHSTTRFVYPTTILPSSVPTSSHARPLCLLLYTHSTSSAGPTSHSTIYPTPSEPLESEYTSISLTKDTVNFLSRSISVQHDSLLETHTQDWQRVRMTIFIWVRPALL